MVSFKIRIPVSKNIDEWFEGSLNKKGEGSRRNIKDSLLRFYQLPIHLDYRMLREEPSIFGQRIVFQLYIISLQADFNDELFMRGSARRRDELTLNWDRNHYHFKIQFHLSCLSVLGVYSAHLRPSGELLFRSENGSMEVQQLHKTLTVNSI